MSSPSTHQDSPKVPEKRWPLTLIRRGAKVPDDGSRWWQELPDDQGADGVRSVGYEVVEVIPVSALLSDVAKEAIEQVLLGFVETPNDAAQAAHLGLQAVVEQVGGGQGE